MNECEKKYEEIDEKFTANKQKLGDLINAQNELPKIYKALKIIKLKIDRKIDSLVHNID